MSEKKEVQAQTQAKDEVEQIIQALRSLETRHASKLSALVYEVSVSANTPTLVRDEYGRRFLYICGVYPEDTVDISFDGSRWFPVVAMNGVVKANVSEFWVRSSSATTVKILAEVTEKRVVREK